MAALSLADRGVTHRQVKHGFWDEDLQAQVDAVPFPSAEEQFFAEGEEPQERCTHDELYEALNRLTKRQALVVRLHYGLDCEPFTTREIAEFLSWHQSTVQEHLDAARRRLLGILEPRQKDSF